MRLQQRARAVPRADEVHSLLEPIFDVNFLFLQQRCGAHVRPWARAGADAFAQVRFGAYAGIADGAGESGTAISERAYCRHEWQRIYGGDACRNLAGIWTAHRTLYFSAFDSNQRTNPD